MMSVNELLVISVKLTRKMSKFSQLNGLIFQFSCVVFPDFPTSLSPYHPKSLTYSSLKQPCYILGALVGVLFCHLR